MLINPTVLIDTLQAIPGIDEFQVVVQREDASDPLSMDELVVRIACAEGSLSELVPMKVREAVRVRPRVEFTDAKSIFDVGQHTKAQRFLDQRG
jgi:phenylacetate-coenzyme A ligase PaaK-like adenylate-forming protein